MKIWHQPFDGALGDILIERLESGEYHKFEFMVAFAKQSGVLKLKPALEKFRAASGSISAFVGIDMDGTSHDALSELRGLCDELYVVHTESMSQTFHSKVYSFTGAKSLWVTVASNNLTYSGLWGNFESSATDVFDLSDPADATRGSLLSRRFADLRDTTTGVSRLMSDQAEVDQLLAQEYVKPEILINVSMGQRTKKKSRTGSPLFAAKVAHSPGPATSRKPSVGVPPVAVPPAPPLVEGRATWVGEVFWAESRKMTSAARNQLDLSTTGRVVAGDAASAGYEDSPGRAVGSATFFGIDPAVHRDERDVTLNYLGVDYRGNKVYYPDSVGSNRTWRIQLNGVDSAGRRLDHEVGTAGFTNKVLAFQRIDKDYYTLAIRPASSIDSFRSASSFVARNGAGLSGKLYGVFTAVD